MGLRVARHYRWPSDGSLDRVDLAIAKKSGQLQTSETSDTCGKGIDDQLRETLMQYRFGSLLIVTYGRSGSTLLLGLLNSIAGVLIRGENENLFEGLWLAHQRLRESKKRGDGTDSTHPWFGVQEMSEPMFLHRCAALAKALLLGNTPPDLVEIYGFKEIRYVHMPPQEMTAYLDFLCLILPSCGIIFNRRSHDAVSKSSWWQKTDSSEVVGLLSEFDKVTEQYAGLHRDICITIDYEKIIDPAGEEIRRLFSFVGAPYDPVAIGSVLARRHGFLSQ